MPSVLIIEDDDLLREGLVASFELAGFTAESEADGEKAFAHIKASPPDLVVSDYLLPSMSGLDLLASVRSVPEFAELPFVMMSVEQSSSFEKTCSLVGASSYLRKPFSARDLLASAKQLVT